MEKRNPTEIKSSLIEIPLKYQEAFSELSKKLIFTEPIDIKLSKENIGLISRKIQNEFIHLEDSNQKLMRNHLYSLIKNIKIINTNDNSVETPMSSEEYSIAPDYETVYNQILNRTKTEEEFLEQFTDFYVKPPVYDASHQYDGWGFTPKLAKKPDEDFKDAGTHKVTRNCLGTIIGLGAYFNKKGFKFDMGITPDHPYAVVYLSSGTYFADISGVQKITGNLEDHGTYKIYRPTGEDDIVQRMVVIHNFDNGVLYETLENMEVLRRMSLGDSIQNLPNTKEEGLIIAEENKEILQKINWKDLQARLFPEISKSFLENKEEWAKEVDYIARERPKQYAQNVFFKAAIFAQRETTFKGEPFKESQLVLLKEFKKFQTEIIEFIRFGVPFGPKVSENTKNYFTSIKDEILKEKSPETRELVNQIIEKKIIDKRLEK